MLVRELSAFRTDFIPAYSFGEALANQAQAEKEQPIGLWGQRHVRYLKEYRRATYITLFTSGRLNNYLADIDRQAQERMERLTEQMKRVQGITEQLKAENALEWTQRMNNIRACAKEIVEKEIIFA